MGPVARSCLAACIATFAALYGSAAQAQAVPWMDVAQRTSAPPGFADFCRRQPRECVPIAARRRSVPLTPDRTQQLQAVNSAVNASVLETSDASQYGIDEFWALPTRGRGDCEDFALMKRRLLIERGWPSSVLLVTIARMPSGEGHAVLTVVTDQGDLVLDSRSSGIKRWDQTGYIFFSRQDQGDPRSWVAVDVQRRTAMARARLAELSAEPRPSTLTSPLSSSRTEARHSFRQPKFAR